MALTSEQQFIGSYIANGTLGIAPGGYMTALGDIINANGSNYRAITKAVVGTSLFTDQFPTYLSNEQFAANYATKLLGTSVTAANMKVATDYITGQLNAGVSRGDAVYQVLEFLYTQPSTNADWGTAAATLQNKASVAQYYTVDKLQTSTNMDVLSNVLKTVTEKAESVTAVKAALDGVPGTTYTLTIGVDVLNGTSGNDTFIADNSGATANLSAADQINGGAGTDTLKIYQAGATNIANTVFGQLSNVENVEINSGTLTTAGNLNVTAQTGVTSVKVINPVAMADSAAFTFTGTAAQSVGLQQVAGTAGAATSTINLAGGVNSVSVDRFNTDVTLDVVGTGNTLNVTTTGGSAAAANNSNFALANTGAGLRTINISGDQTVTIAPNAAVAGAVTTVNASTATGAVNYINNAAVMPATFAFTGGSGNDSVVFEDNALASLAAGSAIKGGAGTDKVGLFDTALSAAELTRINAFDSIEVLGLNANINVDTSAVSTIKSYSLDGNVTVTLANLGSGVTTNVGVDATALTLAPAVGSTSTALTIGSAVRDTNVTLTDLTTTGLSTVSIASNGSGTGANVITNAITNSDNTAFTITGTQALTLTLAAGTATGSSINGSAASGILTLAGSGFGDIIVGGSANDFLNGNGGADKLTGGAGNDTFRFDSRAETQGAAFAAANTNYNNVDSIVDFVGNGASAGDSIQLSAGANVFGTALQFTGASTATVTAVTVATAADFTALAAAIQAASAGVVSTNGAAQVYDVTVTAGNLAGRVLVINDDTAAIAATDTFINITGVSGALNAQDFTFAA